MFCIFEKPIVLLRLEGFLVFLLALTFYWQQSFSWTLFWSSILLPDIAILGYLVNSRVGANLYNFTHAKLLPGLLMIVGIQSSNTLLLALASIWFVHIGFDRMLGYGLKYVEGFKVTHLGMIGQVASVSQRFFPCGR